MMPVNIYRGRNPGDLPAYSVAEAAHHIEIPRTSLYTWIHPHGKPIILTADTTRGLLSFKNLVEIHVLRALREKGVKLNALRNAATYLRKTFHSEHPFADQEIKTDRHNVIIEELGQIINASRGGQLEIAEVLAPYLQRIERNTQGQAIRLYPKIGKGESRLITIDPAVQFGRPCITGTAIPTAIIAERFKAGEHLLDLAQDYGRESKEIEEAIRFESCFVAA